MKFDQYLAHLEVEGDWFGKENDAVKALIPYVIEWFGDRDPAEQPFPTLWCECPKGHQIVPTQLDAFSVRVMPVLRFPDLDDPDGPTGDVPEHPLGGLVVERAEPRDGSAVEGALRWTFRCPNPKHGRFRSVVRSDEALRRYLMSAKFGLPFWRLP